MILTIPRPLFLICSPTPSFCDGLWNGWCYMNFWVCLQNSACVCVYSLASSGEGVSPNTLFLLEVWDETNSSTNCFWLVFDPNRNLSTIWNSKEKLYGSNNAIQTKPKQQQNISVQSRDGFVVIQLAGVHVWSPGLDIGLRENSITKVNTLTLLVVTHSVCYWNWLWSWPSDSAGKGTCAQD